MADATVRIEGSVKYVGRPASWNIKWNANESVQLQPKPISGAHRLVRDLTILNATVDDQNITCQTNPMLIGDEADQFFVLVSGTAVTLHDVYLDRVFIDPIGPTLTGAQILCASMIASGNPYIETQE